MSNSESILSLIKVFSIFDGVLFLIVLGMLEIDDKPKRIILTCCVVLLAFFGIFYKIISTWP